MGYPKAKDTINKKVKEVKKMAEDIINQGVVGEGYLKLQKTLEMHGKVEALLDDMDYTVQKDLPAKEILEKISSVESQLEEISESL